jgi:hypothetical protein
MGVGSILTGAFRLFWERPGAVLIWTLIYLAMTVASSFVVMWILQGQIEALMAGASETEAQWGFVWRSLLVSLGGILVISVLFTAAMRAVLRPGEGGPGALRIGMDEVRNVLLTLLYTIIFFVAMLVVSFFAGAFLGGASDSAMVTGVWVLVIVMAVFCIYFGTKLSLTYPMTLMRESFAIGEGWSLTNGRFWTLFAAYLILALLTVIIAIAVMAATQWDYIQAVAQYGINSPQASEYALREYQMLAVGIIDTEIILTWVLDGVQGAIGITLGAGAVATAAKELTADAPGLTETFS